MLPLIPALIGAAAAVGGAGIGAANSAAGRSKEEQLLEEAARQYDIPLPVLERILAEQLGPSAMEGVSTDPRLRQEQMAAVNALNDVATTGDTPEMRAAMNRILGDVARNESAGRNAILNNMRARGVSGSGAELAAQLSNNQAAAERAQDAGLQTAAQQQKRMLDAVLSKGQLAGQMRSQEFGEQSDVARAKDAISRYNADAKTRAQYYNAGLNQQNFDNRYKLATGQANALAKQGNQAAESGAASAAMWGGIGNAANTIGSGVAGQLQDSQNRKEDREWYERMLGGAK